jgi:DNA helicase-2/ATP-dependent DNA helicase PcrA
MLEATPLSTTDKKNILEGKETVLDRTRRLFYVICSDPCRQIRTHKLGRF